MTLPQPGETVELTIRDEVLRHRGPPIFPETRVQVDSPALTHPISFDPTVVELRPVNDG